MMWKNCLYIVTVISVLFLATAIGVASPAKPGVSFPEGGFACKSSVHDSVIQLQELPSKNAVRKKTNMKGTETAIKELPTVVIVVGFEGNRVPVDYSTSFDWGETIFKQDASLSNYYRDMSLGQFTFAPVLESSAYNVEGNTNVNDKVNDGIIHVSIPSNHDNWLFIDNNDYYHNKTLSKALDQAFKEADNYLDFSLYDVNGDGTIQNNELAIVVLMAGYEGSSSYNYAEGKNKYTWAFMMNMSEFADEGISKPAAGDVGFESFVTMGEQHDSECDYDQGYVGTVAHELGHYIGLPDLYATESNSYKGWDEYDVGYLSLMAIGSWGTDLNNKNVPYSLDVWSKNELGWIHPQSVSSNGIYDVNYSESYDEYKTIRIDTQKPSEYYLLENRQFEKWDAGMSNSEVMGQNEGGLILWHIDNEIYQQHKDSNTVNSSRHRPGIMPLYGETKIGNVPSMIGTKVHTDQGFFDKTFWKNMFAANDGKAMNLPLYPSSDSSDSPRNRSWSGLLVDFLSDNGHEMRIRFNNDSHIHHMIHTPAKESTCIIKDNIESWQCSYCKRIFTDYEGKTEISKDELAKRNAVFGYADHKWDKSWITTQPTYTSEGEKKYECTVCGAIKTEKIAAKTAEKDKNANAAAKAAAEKAAKENKAKAVKVKAKAKALKKKKVQIKWKKVSEVNGYEIFQGAKKKGKFKKVATIKKAKTTKWISKKLKKIKKGKKVFFKVRTCTMLEGAKVYGKWSKVLAVKVK